MDRQIGEPYPDRDLFGYMYCGIKVWRPSIEVQSLGAHEIGAAPEDEITVLFGDEFKDEETSAHRVAGETMLQMGSPVTLNPIIRGFGRGP